ncbi:ATP-binding protein [Streptomyces kanamyceticus]|uniref:ATP-binding protein n=1 Tax=Streptomyces kanamyceticus TaxID=1967 RepID=UPI0007C7D274|nr:hypothetical protein [Streptomyces kanamyceticus]
MTNALLRERLIRVRIALTADALRVEVTDPRGERLPEPRAAEGGDQFGRGLLLVGALADRWWCELCDVGKTVCAEWRVPARRAARGVVCHLAMDTKGRLEWR